jgi:hypothetical protein
MPRHGTGAEVKVRLYMEGRLVENALNHVQVSGHTGSPATCQLELVPTNTIKHILPGTWIHVFVTDPWELNPAADLSDYNLLFEGVVVSRGFTRADDGRSFTVQCADPSVYWVEARQYWLNVTSANGGIVDQLAIQTSGGYGRFGTVAATGVFGYMVPKIALTKDQGEERFMDTMISCIDDIGNVNPFYTNARNRFRLTDRIVRGAAGKTEKLFQLALLSDFLDGLAGRASGQTNLAQVINQLLSAILHEWVSVPAPPYVKASIFNRDVFGNIKRKKSKVKKKTRRGRAKSKLYEFETAVDWIVGNIIFKPHVYTLAPPSCNVLFPNMFDQLSYQESFMNETTRLQMKPQLPMVNQRVLSGLFLQRPVELEIFTSLIRDSKRKTMKKRTPDGKYADGAGQAPTFNDYDWATNEERIRGIVYNFINLAPAPSTLTLTGQGKKKPTGSRKGGVPQYLQNVASYEYYKSKFVARQSALSGPLNLRPIPGFPILALDDSDANMNIVAYLDSIVHDIDADGSATTQYSIRYPRHTDEVDYNRPRFKATGSAYQGTLDFDLFWDPETGEYDFPSIFDGKNQPPIPEWFDEEFRSLPDLDRIYAEWFGDQVGVVQAVLFEGADDEEVEKIAAQESERVDELAAQGIDASKGVNVPVTTSSGEELTTADEALSDKNKDDIIEANSKIDLHDAVIHINELYRNARDTGREFELASEFTARAFTKIDQAFRFVGAGPLELADPAKKNSDSDGITFSQNPAKSRVIDYRTSRLDTFVGDTSPGSGYSGVKEGEEFTSSDETATDSSGATETTEAERDTSDRMSGAFPIFDTIPHTGDEALDKKTREALLKDAGQRAPSDYARYDGRPIMFDFEFRIWQESLRTAGYTPTAEKLEDASEVAMYYKKEGGQHRPATAEELAEAVEARKAKLEQRKKEEEEREERGRIRASKAKNHPPANQAPTGDGLEQEEKLPLPQPLSEKQVVDLRRSIVEAYRDELARNRGFTG